VKIKSRRSVTLRKYPFSGASCFKVALQLLFRSPFFIKPSKQTFWQPRAAFSERTMGYIKGRYLVIAINIFSSSNKSPVWAATLQLLAGLWDVP